MRPGSPGSSAPGRRMAARERQGVDRNAVAAAALVAMAFVLTPLAVDAGSETPAAPAAGGVMVDRALGVCPSAETIDADESQVLLGAARVMDLGAGGAIAYAADGNLDQAQSQDLARGAVVQLPAAGSAAFEATGEVAAGLFASRVDRTSGSLAVTPCAAPRARWWFTGAGATVDHQSELVLTNVDPGPAVVDVTAIGPDGAIDTLGTRGLTIAPGESLTLPMVDVAPQSDELAVRVDASRGRVVAGMADSYAPDEADRSAIEWIPAQVEASRLVRLGGAPAKADSRTLLVANPSRFEALVAVEISAKSGAFAPTGSSELRVPPDSVVAVDLGDSIPAEPSAVRLRSSVPITASLRSTVGGDSSYAGPLEVLDGPAAAHVIDGANAAVQLTAGSQAASVEVVGYDADGEELDTTTLEIPASATATWRPQGRVDHMVVSPGTGRVSGAVSLTGDAGVSQMPLQPLVITLQRPLVVPALR